MLHHVRRVDVVSLLIILSSSLLCTVTSFSTSQTYLASLQPAPTPTTRRSRNIIVRAPSTPADILALADVRYDEWCDASCSRQAFRRATAEIYEERQAASTVVMAWWLSEPYGVGVTPVGAGEASRIELQGCVGDKEDGIRYVTDIVTARSHRRRGVARALLAALEDYHVHPNVSPINGMTFLLHVEPTNVGALSLYKSLGYQVGDKADGVCQSIDTRRLAENAGANGQLLLWKRLS